MPSQQQIDAEYNKIKNTRKSWATLSPEATQLQEQLLRRQALLTAAIAEGAVLSNEEQAELEQLRVRE